ncbi:hypothetical protein [Paenibacillus turpanensis]|nr:hypothetical protein [Paenibacillus turpanensis]
MIKGFRIKTLSLLLITALLLSGCIHSTKCACGEPVEDQAPKQGNEKS